MKAQHTKTYVTCRKLVPVREIIAVHTLKKRISKNNPILLLEELGKEEQTKSKANRRKEIIKYRAEINEIKSRKTIEKINETKSWFFKKI